jgi:YARHG domain
MRFALLRLIVTSALVLILSKVAIAQNCEQLWVERNSYYKAHGYCFKTQRAIEYFGNGGCSIQNEEDVPLTPRERNRIQQIKGQERALGCAEDDGASSPSGTGMSCEQLWFERNSLYKKHGYCFKTERAIAVFGNRGCWIHNERDLQFTPAERARINEIVRLERAEGCN